MKLNVLRLLLLGFAFIDIRAEVQDAAVGQDVLTASRPNILFILTDDQGYGDLGCHGHPYLKTPNLDRLYAQSTRFTDYQASPTCAPTRAALMSGLDPFYAGVTHTILERERLRTDVTTIAEVLKAAGYTTGIFGKWHLGDYDEYQPHNRGFDEVFIHGAGGIGQRFPGGQGDAPGTAYFNPIIKHNNRFVQTQGYCTDVFFAQALGWIRKQKGKPFFAYIATNAPHYPFIVDKKYSDMYTAHCPQREANFLGMITNIDENMGLLLEKLKAWGLDENTLVIFSSDNGSAVEGYTYGLKGIKGSVDEGGTKVPLFMRLPEKIDEGRNIDVLTRHMDLFPTLVALAGAELDDDIDRPGKNLIPLLLDPSCSWPNRYTFFHRGRWNKKGAPRKNGMGNTDPDGAKYKDFAVRDNRYRLCGTNELYDIRIDPGQAENIAGRNPEIMEEMLRRYEQWWASVRPGMVNEDAPLDRGKPFVEQFEKQKEASGIPAWTKPDIN